MAIVKHRSCRWNFAVCLLWIGVFAEGCATGHHSTASAKLPGSSCNAALLDRIYFGSHTPEGTVRDRQWGEFLSTVVTPRFPAGLSVLSARGQWRSANGAIEQEPSRIVEIVHPIDSASTAAIAEIVSTYKTRFRQEAVLVLRSPIERCL